MTDKFNKLKQHLIDSAETIDFEDVREEKNRLDDFVWKESEYIPGHKDETAIWSTEIKGEDVEIVINGLRTEPFLNDNNKRVPLKKEKWIVSVLSDLKEITEKYPEVSYQYDDKKEATIKAQEIKSWCLSFKEKEKENNTKNSNEISKGLTQRKTSKLQHTKDELKQMALQKAMDDKMEVADELIKARIQEEEETKIYNLDHEKTQEDGFKMGDTVEFTPDGPVLIKKETKNDNLVETTEDGRVIINIGGLDVNETTEKTKSNRQILKDIGEELRKIKPDPTTIEQERQDLIRKGYDPEDAEQIAVIDAEIFADEKKVILIKENPKIENGLKELRKLEKRIERNKDLRDNLLANSKKIPNQENNENKIKGIHWKILEMFHKKEKEEFEAFTEEEKTAYRNELAKMQSEGKSREEIENKVLAHAQEKRNREVKNGSLTERAVSGISKGIESFDKWGTDHKDKEGNLVKGSVWKRATKMVASIALIAGVSCAITGSPNSRFLQKVGFGAAFGSLMLGSTESLNKQVSQEKMIKIQKVLRVALPMISAGVAIGTGGIGMGLAVGAAAAAGYGFSKLSQERWSEEKIEQKIQTIKNKIDTNNLEGNLENLEKELADFLKKAERMRLIRKIVGGAVAIGSSVAIMEVSEMVNHAHENTNTETKTTHQAQTPDTTQHVQAPDTIQHTQTPDTTQSVDQDNQNVTSPENNTNQDIKIPEGEAKDFWNENSTKMAIKLGMYNPGETNESMTVQSGTITFDDGQGHSVEVDYSSKGAIQTMADLKGALHEKFGDNIPEGKLTTTYTDMKGVEHSEHLMSADDSGKITVEGYKGDMFDSDRSAAHTTQTEETTHTTNGDTNTAPEQVDPKIEERIDIGKIQETPKVEDGGNFTPPKQVDINENDSKIPNSDNSHSDHTKDLDQVVRNGLTKTEIGAVHNVYNQNLDHLFNERPYSNWEYIQQNISAERLFELSKNNEINSDFKPLAEYMEKLKNLTNIQPYTKDILHPDGPETIPHFMGRALEEAYKKGIIDQVKL